MQDDAPDDRDVPAKHDSKLTLANGLPQRRIRI
jgi:hypothetical protein